MRRILLVSSVYLLLGYHGFGQSPSFKTYMNPIIPGDHPDATLTRIGNDFYTAGSSFNITPVIYHSTDLVRWRAIAQPVSAAWTGYGNTPAGGCWGGQVVYRGGKYWYFFSRSNVMHFVTANDIQGEWSLPTAMSSPLPDGIGLGYDNSIFIDDDNKWYLLVKNGRVNNWIVELGDDGQPRGAVYDLRWLNPAPSYPFSWAEGPVMWKYKGYYYYSFARNVGGGQTVFRSNTLTANQSSWINLGDFFNESDPLKWQALFQGPNHSSAVVMANDSTHWVVHAVWRNANSNEWYGQGRQGLLSQVRYDAGDKPTAEYPTNVPKDAPRLPSSGIPWMVPHSDSFNAEKLNPEWSFSGYTPANTHSLSERSGWLRLSPRSRFWNTVVKNDGEHNYSLITRVDFAAESVNDQAGLWIFNGLQTLFAKLYGSVDSSGNKIVGFSYKTTSYQASNPAPSGQNTVLLKLVRVNHSLTAYFSLDDYNWTQVGNSILVADMDGFQPDYNAWTGNRQGLFVQGSRSADFDYYIYRDAYTPIMAASPANQFGTRTTDRPSPVRDLDNIHNDDWALYAGVEFGNSEYKLAPDSVVITASCGSSGGIVEVWLDSLDSNSKIAECAISSTGSWDMFRTFTARVLQPVSGNRDVYLRFKGTGSDRLFMLRWITFIPKSGPATSIERSESGYIPKRFELSQNYPNPFNAATRVEYSVPANGYISLRVYNLLGQEVATLFEGIRTAGTYPVTFDAAGLPSGIYLYRLNSDHFNETRKMLLLQ